MKLDSSLLKKLTVRSIGKRGGIPRPLIHPLREWAVCLLIVVVAAVGLFGIAGLDFYRQYTDLDIPVVSEENIPRYRAAEAESLIRYHEGRQDMFVKLRSDKPYIPEPTEEASLPSDTVPVVAGDSDGG